MNDIRFYVFHVPFEAGLAGDDPQHRHAGLFKDAGAGSSRTQEIHSVTATGQSSGEQSSRLFCPANCIRGPYCYSHTLCSALTSHINSRVST
jgi:hypothetical protein